MASITTTHIALLRGVNNVGSRRVAMADLRAAFERLGFLDVRTLLNSGNVVFSKPRGRGEDVLAGVRRGLVAELGFTWFVAVLAGDDVVAAVRENPLAKVGAANPSRMLVVVPGAASELARLKPLLKQRWGPEKLALGKRVAYLWCAEGVAASDLWPAVERALEGACTARNLATMTKLAAMVEAVRS
jgi:uncharacterized protein (DUF1697 family)